MDRVLITGGAGFIGNAITEILCKDYDVVVLDNFSPQIHGGDYRKSYLYNNVKDKCRVITGDIRSYDDVKLSLEGVDYIIHLAAETGTGQSMYEINRYTDVNISGTSNLFQVIFKERVPVKKILLSSSRSVYGEGMYSCERHGTVVPNTREAEDMKTGDFDTKCPICGERVVLKGTLEECPLTPISYYAYTKIAQEKMLEFLCSTMNIPYTIFRYQNVYGSGQSLRNPYTGILSIFSQLLLGNHDLNIFEDGEESRDFVHVSDVASVTCSALKNDLTNQKVINVGSGENISVLQVAEKLKQFYGSTSIIRISGDFRVGDIRHSRADINKAKELCGFQPSYSFHEGIHEFTQWVRSPEQSRDLGHSQEPYERSLKEMKDAGMLFRLKE